MIDKEDAVAGVVDVEAFYRARSAWPSFQLPVLAEPTLVSRHLAEAGYRPCGPSDVFTASVPDVLAVAGRSGPAAPLRVELSRTPDSRWIEAWAAATGAQDGTVSLLRASLALVRLPTAYCTVFQADSPVAVGRASCDAGWAGLFNFATAARWRGAGIAGRVVAALAGWAEAQRARALYLQVDGDNHGAKKAYARSGFRPCYSYHYLKPPRPLGE